MKTADLHPSSLILQTFLQKFDLFADAPDAVAKMRELVLELAVQGKLVVQIAGEPSAEDFLKGVESARAENRTGGRGRKLESLPALETDEIPFEIPIQWQWCRLGTLGLITSSCRVHEKDWTTRGVPFFRAREIVKLSKSGEVQNELFITEDHYQRLAAEGLIPEPNDIMITGVGTIGVPYVVGDADRFYFKDASVLIFKNCFGIYPHYLRLVMQSPYWDREIHKGSMGTTVHTFTIVRAKQTPIPVPPLAEQKRIVAKVDELMALCDRLEAQQQEREAKAGQLARASLARFAVAPTPANLSYLFHSSFIIHPSDLRKSILTLAVQGKLVPQDPNDEPAVRVLERIDATPKRAMRTRATDEEDGDESTELEHLFELPPGWEWAPFRRLPLQASVGIDRGRSMQGPDKAVGYFKMNNIRNSGGVDLSDLTRIDATPDEIEAFSLADGDFLFNTRNSRELVGKTCVFRTSSDEAILYNNNILRVKFMDGFCPDFLDYWFRSPQGSAELEKLKSNTTNVCAIYQGKLSGFPCVVPPLAEQRRIVAKVEQLMALVDALETQLATSRTTAANLLSALVAELTQTH